MNDRPDDTLGFYYPAPGLLVVGPEPRFRRGVPAAGAWIPDTPFWRRRRRDGDLWEVDPRGGLALSTVVAAIAGLDPDKDFTSGGVPTTSALTREVGEPVSGAVRDAAWAEYLLQNPDPETTDQGA